MKKCPFCAEEIQDEAIVCKHCRRDVPPPVESVSEAAPDVGTPPPVGKSAKTVEMQGARETDAEGIGTSRDGDGKAALKKQQSSRRADLNTDDKRKRDSRRTGVANLVIGVSIGLALIWLANWIFGGWGAGGYPQVFIYLIGIVFMYYGTSGFIKGLFGQDPDQPWPWFRDDTDDKEHDAPAE